MLRVGAASSGSGLRKGHVPRNSLARFWRRILPSIPGLAPGRLGPEKGLRAGAGERKLASLCVSQQQRQRRKSFVKGVRDELGRNFGQQPVLGTATASGYDPVVSGILPAATAAVDSQPQVGQLFLQLDGVGAASAALATAAMETSPGLVSGSGIVAAAGESARFRARGGHGSREALEPAAEMPPLPCVALTLGPRGSSALRFRLRLCRAGKYAG